MSRRTSYPRPSSGDNDSCHPKPRKHRLHSTPNFYDGIPLGTQTAQLASKCFWNKQMLQTSMEKIAQCAAKESSSLGSSLESLEDVFDENLLQVSGESSDESSCSPPQQVKVQWNKEEGLRNRVLKHPLERNISIPLTTSRRSGENTPPYLSPGITRRTFYD